MFASLIVDLREEVLPEGLAKELQKKNAIAAQQQQQAIAVQQQAQADKAQQQAVDKEQRAAEREKHGEKYTDRKEKKVAKRKELQQKLTSKKQRKTMTKALGAISSHAKHATDSAKSKS